MSLYRTRLPNTEWKQSPQGTLDYFDAARRAVMDMQWAYLNGKWVTVTVHVAVDSADNRHPNGDPIVFHHLTVSRTLP